MSQINQNGPSTIYMGHNNIQYLSSALHSDKIYSENLLKCVKK